ncbi:MAG: RNA polymerase sigma factor [Candidatus Korobacteraceae bacterium]
MDIVSVSPETMLGQSREASFTELYSRYARDVYRFALYLSGDSKLAEDITSETFLRVWVTDTPIRLETVKSWLLTIVRNLFLHELRHLRRTQELPLDLCSPNSLTAAVQAKQELANLMAAVASLPEIDRSALLLRSLEGCSYQEIAAILGISLASAKVKVHRARLRLGQLKNSEGNL